MQAVKEPVVVDVAAPEVANLEAPVAAPVVVASVGPVVAQWLERVVAEASLHLVEQEGPVVARWLAPFLIAGPRGHLEEPVAVQMQELSIVQREVALQMVVLTTVLLALAQASMAWGMWD